jgi:hypothetical protein
MNVKQTILRAVLVASMLSMVGCTLIPLSSLWALRKFDLAQLDGAQLRTLVYLPAGVGTARDAIKVIVKAERGNAEGEVLQETLALRPDAAASASPGLADPWPGGHWVALTLDAAEQQRLLALRSRLQAWKAADGPDVKRRVSTEVSPQLCTRQAGRIKAGQVKLSVWVRWRAGQDDLLMLDGATAQDIDDKLAAEPLPPCS